MKSIIFILCLTLLLASDTPPTPEEIEKDPNSTIDELAYYRDRPSLIEEDNERSQKLLKEYEFDKDKIIKKSEYITFLYRLVTMDETLQGQEKEFYEKVINKYVSEFPDEFKSGMIRKYADTEEFNQAVRSVVVELYGEDAFKEFDSYEVSQDQIDDYNRNKTEFNNYEEQEETENNLNNTRTKIIKPDL